MNQSDEEKTRIYLVEDDPDISKLLLINLGHLGYEVSLAEDGLCGLNMVLENAPDLLILDLMLPQLDGLSVCERLRKENIEIPILMLTARSEESDKILGLELGADDYLTKPFSVGELHARVRALLRRHGFAKAQKNSSRDKDDQFLIFGALELDREKRQAKLSGITLDLTFKEFELLTYLVSNPGKSFTRASLLSAVWDYEFEGYEHTVTSHINRLRSKIEKDPSNPAYILTVRGAGYRFATPEELEGI